MKYLTSIAMVVLTILLFQTVNQFLFCPQYHSNIPQPFNGNNWYNPYDSINEKNWIKCNFHAHSNAWGGFTNGKGKAMDIYNLYNQLGYTIAGISEYQKINCDSASVTDFIPVYEHGYNVTKAHQLVIGTYKVEWLDYIFPQTLSNKQRILDKLSKGRDAVIVLNHPQTRASYTPNMVSTLSNYHCIEVLSPSSNATTIWDAALSSGHPVFIMANDDMHNVFENTEAGQYCTWINAPVNQRQNIIQSLKLGKAFGMKLAQINHELKEARIKRIRNKLPGLKNLSFQQNSLQLTMNETAKKISFIGTNGKIRKIAIRVSNASYTVKPYDSYIRTQVELMDGTEVFLNPVYRYDNDPFENFSSSVVFKTKSYIFYFLGLLVLTGWILILIEFIWRQRMPISHPAIIQKARKFQFRFKRYY